MLSFYSKIEKILFLFSSILFHYFLRIKNYPWNRPKFRLFFCFSQTTSSFDKKKTLHHHLNIPPFVRVSSRVFNWVVLTHVSRHRIDQVESTINFVVTRCTLVSKSSASLKLRLAFLHLFLPWKVQIQRLYQYLKRQDNLSQLKLSVQKWRFHGKSKKEVPNSWSGTPL